MSETGGELEHLQDYRRKGSRDNATAMPRTSGVLLKPAVAEWTIKASDPEEGAIRAFKTEDLYPGEDAASSLNTALRLIDSAQERLHSAVEYFEAEQYIEADLEAMQVRPALIGLFCCRSLGDGFANVIDGMLNGLRRLAGDALDLAQLAATQRCMDLLRQSPFLSFEESMQVIRILEEAGLKPYPAGLDRLQWEESSET